MKLYVFVRTDLSKDQQSIQAGHAVAEWLLHDSRSVEWNNGTLVYIGLRKREFYKVYENLKIRDNCIEFREPYYNDKITAFASLSNTGDEYKKYNLLSFKCEKST